MNILTDNSIPSIINNALAALIKGDCKKAKNLINSIDKDSLYKERTKLMEQSSAAKSNWNGVHEKSASRLSVPPKLLKETYRRDQYTCCYCNRKTIDLDVLKTLSKLLPDDLPYVNSWKFDICHPIYWVYSTSLEHITPVAGGGTNEKNNVRASCYLCNDAKKDIPLDVLGWSLRSVEENEDVKWDGLTSFLGELKKLQKE